MARLDTISAVGRRITPPSASERSSEEVRAFLQERVAKFGIFGGALGGSFVVFRLVISVVAGDTHEIAHPSFYWHVGAAGAMALMGLVCWAGRRSVRFVETAELVGLVASCASYEAMGASMPVEPRPDFVVMTALTLGLVVRAIYVPSTARRSLLLAVLVGIPYVGMVYVMWARASPEFIALMIGDRPKATPTGMHIVSTVAAALWWCCTMAVTAAASRVIYGLRSEVRSIRRLGQYTLEEPLGEGGMGVVYRASHAMLQRPTTVKLLPRERVGEASLARFEREVQLTAKLTHPNTITVFDYGRTPDGVFYYAMELVDGAALDRLVRATGAMPAERVLHILHQVAGALAEAHSVGLIHRDIKPQNIMLCEQGGMPDVVKVLDFGLVKQIDNPQGVSLTGTNVITGTPEFLPPEALKNPEQVDSRADLYSLGAVGYFLLTGQNVFEGKTVVEMCSHHLLTPPTPPSELVADVPQDLERTLLACLAKEPKDRPQGARELRGQLEACQDFGRWTEADARAWWEQHGADLAQPPGISASRS